VLGRLNIDCLKKLKAHLTVDGVWGVSKKLDAMGVITAKDLIKQSTCNNASDLIRSMSRKGCSSDNAACEGYFGRVKNEMYYGRNWAGITLKNFMCFLDSYLR